ncbi:MAG: undecaprenyldiphospho-muramoylpentapeptide beta-N-acetylglucosaminyltransferase [Alphaproteobacteria bacterium]|nr:undecaprenyldiphospho-muramoylpentapeptide beta-N-acetylglucosaminyltransferase [Alphaproteobacteria bacterium]
MTRPIILVSGGTGGHLFPAIALEKALKNQGVVAQILTDTRGAQHINPDDLLNDRLSINHQAGYLQKGIGVFKDFIKSRSIFKKLNPSYVIGFGGYPTLAPLWAAHSLKIPVIIHEQNALMGKANRLITPIAQKIALSFERTFGIRDKNKSKCTYIGNPVRPEILKLRDQQKPISPTDKFNILITGGSQGAKIFSDIIPDAIALLPNDIQKQLKITQQVRPEYLEETSVKYKNLSAEVELSPFFQQMGEKIINTDLMICRSGASTIAENLILGCPALYIPLPSSAENHQYINAKEIERLKSGILIEQKKLTPTSLATEILHYFHNRTDLVEIKTQSKVNARPQAAENLANLIIQA